MQKAQEYVRRIQSNKHMSRFFSKKYKNLVPYTPGEQPAEKKYIKLNTNESPFPPSNKAVEFAFRSAYELQLYPDPECRKLTDKLSGILGVSRDEILVTNGSDEILNFAFMAFCDKNHPAAFADITYGFYKVFAEINNIPYFEIPLNEEFKLMLGMLFELYKKLHLYRDNQNLCSWKDEGRVKSVKGSRCLVVGLGDIGSFFARSASALGIKVCGMRRTTTAQKPEYVENMYPFSSLNDIIGEFDIVALSLPETPETIKIINEKNIALMKDGSIILNVGRGSAIDTDALYNALMSGKLGGAGIDVTDPEPLPPDHPLWKCKNAVITPHISGYFHLKETYDNIVNLAYDNLKAYLEGNTPANIVDFKTGYRKA